MDTQHIIAFGVTAIGCAFGFGKQASTLATNRRDIDNIANLYRSQSEDLHEVLITVARLEQKIDSMSNR